MIPAKNLINCQGRQQKNFQGGTKKRPKNSTIYYLASIYYFCTMFENPEGGHGQCRNWQGVVGPFWEMGPLNLASFAF